jgi:LmbE family N-acetylglucosaminyl deacetylase
MEFPGGVMPQDIYAFDGTDVPDWVQIWQPPCAKADFMLISTHADDEQLFFAGVLPYYSRVRGLAVQVVYATDHNDQPDRHHERLDGLWEVGVRNYPVSMGLPDAYSESYDGALANLKSSGIGEDEVIAREKAVIERFQPQVIATHDVNGEYGHGQHILVCGTLRKLLDASGSEFPYLKKVYLHLYDKDQVALGFLDEQFKELGGLTPFQVTQKGFGHHKSQHWTWFKRWILGSNGEITQASQIKTYSPLYYGMYWGDPALDKEKNDFFEGLSSYAQQEEEARAAAEAEAAAAEEARKKAEAERLAAEQAAELARKEAEAAERAAAEKKGGQAGAIAAAVIGGVIGFAAVTFLKKRDRRGRYSKR